jgi:hypothetical protein
VSIVNSYPSDVQNDPNRCIIILAKEQTSLSGSISELQAQVDKSSDQILDIVSGRSSAPSDAGRQSQLGWKTKKLTKAATVWGCALPLPNEIMDSQSHQWETTSGYVGQTVGGLANADIVGGISANKALGELASASGFRKPLIDPGYFQDYNGTEPREFTFTWDLIPNNAAEAQEIHDILYNLKKYTLPMSTINGLSLLSPFMFDITIGNPIINRIMNMNNVVCKSLSINYSADGSLQFFSDGMPKLWRLEATFAERSLVTADFY